MKKIIFPLEPGKQGSEVGDLQDVLQMFIERSMILRDLSGNRQGLSVGLKAEHAKQIYANSTEKLVKTFQEEHGIPATGTVDEQTATAMNAILHKLGLLDQLDPTPIGRPDTTPVGIPDTKGVEQRIDGHIVFDYGLPATEVTVRLYSVGFGGKDIKIGEVKTDAQGKYSISHKLAQGTLPNVQVRVLDSANNEVTISNTKFSAQSAETLNLVVPAKIQLLASEFQRLAANMEKSIGGIANLSQAQEGNDRQDFTLLNKSTNWDARLVALAATAAQQTESTGLAQDVLYALFRVGLPSDPSLLALVPSDTVQKVLTKACQAGIVSMDDQQITAATMAFKNFASKKRLAIRSPGSTSSFNELLTASLPDAAQQAAFADLYFSNPTAADFWMQAASLDIPSETLDALKLQGKFLHLTFNNAPLAQKLQQDVGSLNSISQVVDKDYHLVDTWQSTLMELAGTGGEQALQKLIPAAYVGATTADRLAAYSGDMARKIRTSFPTQVVARMIERNDLPLNKNTAQNVTSFLRAATPLGYNLGRTPLNAFLKNSNQSLPEMDAESTADLKMMHCLFQVTPSTESLQAAVKLGFTSAWHIASYTKDEFMNKFAAKFPPGEASLVYGQAQTVSTVTFNVFSMAKQLDNSPPVYALSASSGERQDAKNAIIQQFPSMESLFGNMDFCECEDCRSVLSPAAYFVDVLEFLNKSAINSKGYTPLDVLIGSKDGTMKGRRPDLGALPLTCENTNTAMPYIDLVNEILEYYIANSHLDTNYAYDTGSATTADLTAEPQHILPQVYNTKLKQAVFPLNLPFNLWIETVRGFLNYFQIPLAQVLDTMRPVDNLELFSDADAHPYYRAQIFAEALEISPSEYEVLTAKNPASLVDNWFKLYGYPDAATALNGKPDPTDSTRYQIMPLKNAKNLSRLLGLSYLELTDLVTTGFLNPALYPLIFQFKRFGINMSDAFSYTNQPGYPTLTAQQKTDFETLLQEITDRYKKQNSASTFDAQTWLSGALPTNHSNKVLVLADPNSGCDFGGTTLQYADNATAATPLDFVKLNLFVRLWKKLGWSLDETDRALQIFFPSTLPDWSDANFGDAFSKAWETVLVYLAHLDDLNTRLAPSLGRTALLPLWSGLPVQGDSSLYEQLFLTASVLNNDWAFDDPNGLFPVQASDLPSPLNTFAAHMNAVQGALGLGSDEIAAIFSDASVVSPGFTKTNLSICYRYSMLAKCLQMKVSDMISLKAMSGLNPFQTLSGNSLAGLADDVLFNQTLSFVKVVQIVQNSDFTVEGLKYLLRHQFDPVGKYQTDQNALLALVQSVAGGLQQIQIQNAVPPDLNSLSESLIDQSLSGLLPAPILKTLFTLLTNSRTCSASQAGVAAGIAPAPFAQETDISFGYDATTQTQTVSFHGLLLDWKKEELKKINSAALFSGLLDAIQQQTRSAFGNNVGDILGVWAGMIQYEAVKFPLAAAISSVPLMQKDSALMLSYDETDKLEWLGYRGVLTDAKKADLINVNNSSDLLALLNDVQGQSLTQYSHLIGSFLAMWINIQTFKATQTGVALASKIDADSFFAALISAQQNGIITDPVPQIQFSYDATLQIQTLTCAGMMSDSMRSQLAALAPSYAVLASLLQTVCADAVNLYQSLATNLLTVSAGDLDTYAKPFLGLDVTKQQKQVKAALVGVFMPLQAQKLSRQLILQTLSANLGSEPSMTRALVTDAALLSDKSNPGKSLFGTFCALGQQGVSTSYFTSTDGSGAAQATGTAATTNTADPTNSKPGTASAHFEGYLQVQSDGPYRFFAELGNTGSAASFQLYSPDPTALLVNPIITSTSKAMKDYDEVSRFVQLKGGVLYRFTLDFSSLGTNGASLLIQGENLPKGPLSQVILYPEQAIAAFTRAKTLLAKALQLLQVTGLNEREFSYLIANSSRFNNLRLGSLPTQPNDDSLTNATALFSQFLALADYADLRKGPAGGSDGLIDVFQAAAQSAPPEPNTPWTMLADLTRRDSQIVHDVATALGPDPHFINNIGIRRIWDALQLLQIVGIPATSLTASMAIASLVPPASSPPPDVIAENFKNAVKAKYTPDTWRPIAQSVFDKLRQKKRDALVAYLVETLPLDNSNQLFEYFLIDPGMEPVVQTSRLRVAMSSLQTFVQRCLLNLENGNSKPEFNIAPSAIDANWWAWMKRYRVWQANREIFLFPENWMVPELRLDKTDLFQALEGAILQGDITADLADDAFFGYLKELDKRARLDIVAMYLDQDMNNAGLRTLHVIGRTYGIPHKYFYRNYSNATWSGWLAVTPDIEGNHITLAIWRGRLNVFWVTFIPQPQAPKPTPTGTTGAVSNLTFDQLAGAISSAKAIPQVQVQLHWIEYFQGKWTNRISSEINSPALITGISENFKPDSDVFIHVTKEVDDAGNEGAARVHLDCYGGSYGYAFRVTSKNCSPDFASSYWEPAQYLHYGTYGNDATTYTGSGNLDVLVKNKVVTGGSENYSEWDEEQILQSVNSYALVPCANPVVPPFVDPNDPFFCPAGSSQSAGSLVAPFFYKDTNNPNASSSSSSNEFTFFVQPSMTETTVEQWEWWAIAPVQPSQDWNDASLIEGINVVAQVPATIPIPVNPGDPAYSVYPMQNMSDWVTSPGTAVSYGGSLIGKGGGITVVEASKAGGPLSSALPGSSSMIAGNAGRSVTPSLNVVGKQGLSLSQVQATRTT